MIKGLTGKDYTGYTTAFFDFDGTIMKSGEGIVNALKYTFTRMDMPIPEEKELLSFVGPPVKIHLSQNMAWRKIRLQRLTLFSGNTILRRASLKAIFTKVLRMRLKE